MAVLAMTDVSAPASVLRLKNYHDAKGGHGVLLPTDLRVTALPTPGPFVRVMPGGATLRNAYLLNGGAENYLTGDNSAIDVPVPATDSAGGAVRYVIKTVRDPDFPGVQTPTDGVYDFFDIVTENQLTTYAHPYEALARINQPASTATITDGSNGTTNMLTDLREVANPRQLLVPFARPSVGTDTGMYLNATSDAGEYFPNSGGDQDIPIPYWATYAQISATWVGIKYQGGTNPFGQYWVEFGPIVGSSLRHSTDRFDFDAPGVGAGNSRDSWPLGGTVYIPADIRGSVQAFVMKARNWTTDNDGAFMDQHSGIILNVTFVETADQVD